MNKILLFKYNKRELIDMYHDLNIKHKELQIKQYNSKYLNKAFITGLIMQIITVGVLIWMT